MADRDRDRDEYRVIESDGSHADYLLHRYFTNNFRPGYVEVGRNNTCLPIKYLLHKDHIRDFHVRSEDVWVVSHPKTGTTWLQEMVWCIMHDLDFEKAKLPLQERFPFLEHSILYDFEHMTRQTNGVAVPNLATHSIAYVAQKQGSRCIKTHLPWELLPSAIRNRICKPKILYICRDPKDTCVSYFYHCKLLEGYTGTFEDFCDLFMAGRVSYSPYLKHIRDFWERRNEPSILFLKYEDLKRNLPYEIKRVSQFLERDLSPENVQILARHLSFESMRENPAVNYEDVLNLNEHIGIANRNTGNFFRNGNSGNHKAEMDPDLVMKFDDWMSMENIPLHF